MNVHEQPLSGMRVIAVEQYGAGPWGTLQLADLGAEVIKVEDPAAGGDVGRYVPPYQAGEDSLFFETFNRNKRSISLDLRTPRGRSVLLDLAAQSDVVFSNLRGGQPARLGLMYDDLKHVNPSVVCCALTGFGLTGPRRDEPAYDYILQGLSGWMSLTGDPDGPPVKSGLSLVDLASGYVAAIAILAGVTKARRDGVGCDCDISLFETSLALLSYVATWTATMGHTAERLPDSAHPSIVPFQNFRASDGWLVVACAKEKFWRRLCDVLHRPDLALDPRFVDFAARHQNRDELTTILGEEFAQRTVDDWERVLRGAQVPVGRVQDVNGALMDPQAVARETLVEIEHPRFGTMRQVATPLRVGDYVAPNRRAPVRGEDTESVLADVCGYSPEMIAELERDAVIVVPVDDVANLALDGPRP